MKKNVLKTVMAVVIATGALTVHTLADKSADKDKVAKASVKAIKVQTTCPVMGGKINKASYIDYDGKRIYMCCKGCEKALKKDPKKYIKKLEDAGITVDKTPAPAKGKADKSKK